MDEIPEVELSDPAVLRDPFTAYGKERERGPLARLVTPGLGTLWAVTRYEDAKAMLADPRFELNAGSYLRPDVPEHCLKYMRTLQEMDGAEHARLRRLVSPSFTARRAAQFRPGITRIVDTLLDDLTGQADGDAVDLLACFARPLPIDVICELVGIPPEDRASWRTYGAAVAAGNGPAFAAAIPAVMRDAATAVAHRTAPASPARTCCPNWSASTPRTTTGSAMSSWSPLSGTSSSPDRPRPTSSPTPSRPCSLTPTSSPG